MVVSVGDELDVGQSKQHEFGYCTIEMVSRRQSGEPWDFETSIQSQLGAVNRYAAEKLVLDGWIAQNNLGALLDAENAALDKLLEKCCNFDAQRFSKDIADARAVRDPLDGSVFLTPRESSYTADDSSPLTESLLKDLILI